MKAFFCIIFFCVSIILGSSCKKKICQCEKASAKCDQFEEALYFTSTSYSVRYWDQNNKHLDSIGQDDGLGGASADLYVVMKQNGIVVYESDYLIDQLCGDSLCAEGFFGSALKLSATQVLLIELWDKDSQGGDDLLTAAGFNIAEDLGDCHDVLHLQTGKGVKLDLNGIQYLYNQ